MKHGRFGLWAAVAVGLAIVPIAGPVRADPPAAGGAPAPAAATQKRKPPAKPAHSKPAKPAPAPKDAPGSKHVETGATPDAKPRAGAPGSAHEVVEHESRIEFDERMVRGQSAAGAIFLFQRTPSELKSIVEIPESFRPKTVELIQGAH